jgi:hypothetical protein
MTDSLGEAGVGHCARRGAQLEVDNAVGSEVAQHRQGSVDQGIAVVDEVVDVGREEREEGAQIVIVLPRRHLDQRIREIRLASRFLPEPDLVEALAADATTKMGMKLCNISA